MILVRICGGLGNQLFIYSYGLWISNKLKLELYLDLDSGFKEDHVYNRSNDLKYFNIIINQKRNILTHSNLFSKIIRYVLRNFFNNKIFLKTFCITENNYEKLSLDKLKKVNFLYIDGYFNNHDYSLEIKYQLQKILKFNNHNLSYIKNKNIHLFSTNQELVAVHYRSYNDIPNNKKQKNQTVGLEYYQNSISFIKNKIKNPVFIIFTDDIQFARKYFVGNEYLFVNNTIYEIPSQIFDFNFMLLCKHFIIANSTFSWWPAFINTDNNNIIIRPNDNYYFQNKKFYLKSWIQI